MSDRVSTEEELQLRDYELIVVINPEVAEERFEAVLDNIKRFITARGGVISDVQQWGKRRLSYPIKHYIEGNYVLTQFKMKPESGKELEANLRISEEVLRHLLVKID